MAASAVTVASLAGAARGQVTLLNTFGSAGSGNGQLDFPVGVSVDPASGTVYVADSFNSRIETFTATGSFVSTLGSDGAAAGQFTEPNGVSFNPSNGQFAVADSGNSRVQVFQPGLSTPILIIGTGNAGSGTNQLNVPEGVEYIGDTIVVADSGNNRVSSFTTDGTYLGSDNGTENGTPMNHPDAAVYDPVSVLFRVADTGNNLIQEYAGIGGDAGGTFRRRRFGQQTVQQAQRRGHCQWPVLHFGPVEQPHTDPEFQRRLCDFVCRCQSAGRGGE